MPAWVLWLAPVPVATVLAICWTSWSGRTRPPQSVADSVAEHQRFRQALAVPPPEAGPSDA